MKVCELTNHHRASFPLQSYKPSEPFSIIHSDLWGLSKISTLAEKWFITLLEYHTRISWIYLLKDKSRTQQNEASFGGS